MSSPILYKEDEKEIQSSWAMWFTLYLSVKSIPEKIYKVSVFKIHILRFPTNLGGRWNMGDLKVETLQIFFWNLLYNLNENARTFSASVKT